MVYEQHIKELAYTIDPECWVSYSGKPPAFKSYMDRRRTDSLRRAEREFEKQPRRVTAPTIVSREDIADALESADWPNTSIGNKLLILAAIGALRS